MRILVRTSKWATWSRRFGSFAVPLALIPIFMHREKMISSPNFAVIEIVALSLAALALLLAAGAFVRLWITGDRGWSRATSGLFFALICLVPAGYFGTLALRYPAVSDVTTDFANPPELVSFVPSHFIGPDERKAVEAAFPNARSRTYPIDAIQIFDSINALAEAGGWEPRAKRAPQTARDDGTINAVATTLLGWRDEVAIRVTGTDEGATVAMRSTSLAAGPDFGENGKRVEQFMLALDAAVTAMMRDAPASDG